MTNTSIPRADKINKILQDISTFYKEESDVYLEMLLEQGVTLSDIARRRNVTRMAMSLRAKKLPKGGRHA